MQQNICYDKAWTTEAIEEIERELFALNELQQIMRRSTLDSMDDIIPYGVIHNAEKLEESLIATKKALQLYMVSMDNELNLMKSYYEDNLSKNLMLFSEE